MLAIDKSRRAANCCRSALVAKASQLIQTVAQPSLVQLVMRVALAVPFWKSGILKWNGFLQAERYRGHAVQRRIHAASAGRSLPLSGADRDGFSVRLRGDHLSGAAGVGLWDPICRAGLLFMTSSSSSPCPTAGRFTSLGRRWRSASWHGGRAALSADHLASSLFRLPEVDR